MSGSKLSDATTLPAAPKPELEPIGLTVHRLPEPEAAVLAAQRTRRGRWQMLLIYQQKLQNYRNPQRLNRCQILRD